MGKEYTFPEKLIRKVYYIDLSGSIIVILCGLSTLLSDSTFSGVLMIVGGVFLLSIAKTRSNKVIHTIKLNDDGLEFIAKNYSKKIKYPEISRFSFNRKPFKMQTIRGLVVSDQSSYGFIDLRFRDSIELIESVLGKRADLVTSEMKTLWLENIGVHTH